MAEPAPALVALLVAADEGGPIEALRSHCERVLVGRVEVHEARRAQVLDAQQV
eukprot:CAMPEP_0119179178 /NCGR_PEP_ID=MMETSP1315-20130426/53630_1 /TAXON_ID=676789 /ORGANISM="Prasinoderma singularis, Strain RCC927" /LENGTH=52 /DNA_ID=CAMNT_0007173407 /DNA_START=148 /DNA_END=302 /DNA_ORIENTATION=+